MTRNALPPFESQITFCYVRDLDATARWVDTVLGLTLALDQGSCRIYRVAGQGFVGFCERADAAPAPDSLILTFVTDEVDRWHAQMREAGAEIIHPPQHNTQYGIYHFFVRGPNGYRIEVQRFLSPEARDACHQLA